MAFEQKNGSGALFKNADKQTETHPDYTGSITVNGQPFFLNAWLKTAKSGQKYMSLSVKPKEQKAAPKAAAPVAEPFQDDEEIPF